MSSTSKYNMIMVEGISGTGAVRYQVVSVDETGAWRHVEYFDSKAEARSWLRWA